VGPITALATDVFLGDPQRFTDGKTLASYIGMIPSEHSSGRRQRLGAMSKQGNSLLRYLWCEATLHAVRQDPELQRFYRHKLINLQRLLTDLAFQLRHPIRCPRRFAKLLPPPLQQARTHFQRPCHRRHRFQPLNSLQLELARELSSRQSHVPFV